MRKILIVGAGQSGLQLALSLAAEDYEVTLMSARTPDEIRTGWPTSTQGMFHLALETERQAGLSLWDNKTPPINGLHLVLSVPPGQVALDVVAPLDHPGQSTDQRLKMAAWLELAEQRVNVIYNTATTEDVDRLTTIGRYDLAIVAAGKGDLVAMFDRDPHRSPYTTPQRGLAVAYVHGLAPDPAWPDSHVGFHAIPGAGELFVIPALTNTGPCDILFWEAIPGGPLDRWQDVGTTRVSPATHLEWTLQLAKEYTPWVYDRCGNVELTDAKATLHGRYTPTVRQPVAHLPGGGIALGMADVVIANDPITGQGSNTAAKCADHYRRAILDRADQPFDEAWMRDTFETFWDDHGRAVTIWTNALLQPLPEHVQQLLGAAAGNPAIARRFANGFSDPNDFFSWFMDPALAAAYLATFDTRPASAGSA